MAASYVANLTDEDLKKSLEKYGNSVGPITDTTRDLYKKRLIKIVASDKSFTKSSVLSNRSTLSSTPNNSYTRPSPKHIKSKEVTPQSRRRTSARKNQNAREDENSTADEFEHSNSSHSNDRRRSVRLSKRTASNDSSGSRLILPGDYDNDSDEENRSVFYRTLPDADLLRNRKYNRPLIDKHLPKPNNKNDGGILNGADNDFYFEPSDTEEVNNLSGANSISSFQKRLSNVRKHYSSMFKRKVPSNSSSYGNNIHHSSSHSGNNRPAEDWPMSKLQKIRAFLCKHISTILVIVTIIFFVVLFLAYLNIFTKENCILLVTGLSRLIRGKSFRDRDNLLVCGTDAYLTVGCVTVEEAQKAVDIANAIHDILSTNAGDYECGYPASGRNLTTDHVKERLTNLYPKYQDYWLTALRMIVANPHWNIRLYSRDNNQITDYERQSVTLVHYLDTTVAQLSLPCQFKKFMEDLAWKTSILTIVFVTGYGIYTLWTTYKRKKEEETLAIYKMVEQIIDILQTNYQKYSDKKAKYPYVAILHIRDRLIRPLQRKAELPIWDAAVQFLEANESRIRVETQDVDGEQFRVWRWLPTLNDDGQVPRVWQGSALVNNDKSRQFVSPTSCLKIRNMFDTPSSSEVDWMEKVAEAIVEKCYNHCDIVHVGVDSTSTEGVVYVKCSTKEDAGKAFRELHGWWFAGKLITAKFIKEERYHEHYPVARHYTEPLKPRDENLSSVSERYYKSALEM